MTEDDFDYTQFDEIETSSSTVPTDDFDFTQFDEIEAPFMLFRMSHTLCLFVASVKN